MAAEELHCILSSSFQPCYESEATISCAADAQELFDTIFERVYEACFFDTMGVGRLAQTAYAMNAQRPRVVSESTVELDLGFLNSLKPLVPGGVFSYKTHVRKDTCDETRRIETENVSVCGMMEDRTSIVVEGGPPGQCFVRIKSHSYSSVWGTGVVIGSLRQAVLSQFCFMLAHAVLYCRRGADDDPAILYDDVKRALDEKQVVVLSSHTRFL